MSTPEQEKYIEPEPFIPYASQDNASPELREILLQYNERMGFYPNALKIYLHRPEIAEVLWNLNNRIMRDDSSSLDQRLKRELATVASKMNSCEYCTTHHSYILKRNNGTGAEGWDMSPEELDQLLTGKKDTLTEKEKVCYDFVTEASLDPAGVPDEIYTKLTEHLSPEEIVELAAVVGFWKMYNTIHDCLRIPIEQALMD
jgi:uncharacterized peroxidase-related enzyme